MMTDDRIPYTLPHTDVKHISSKLVNQTYKIAIALPDGFDESNATYPVLYVLDEHWLFPMFTHIVRTLQIFQEAPPMLIVGIGYPTLDPGDLWALRMRDYTPTADPGFVAGFSENYDLPLTPVPEPSGRGPAFLRFIIEELAPIIETDYRGDPQDRGMVGWSFGGLFALNALFWQPDCFQRVLAFSPALWWGDGVTFQTEESFAAQNKSLPVKLFLSVGDGEGGTMVGDMKKMGETLAERPYPGLELKQAILAGESHLSTVAGAFSKGIRAVFS